MAPEACRARERPREGSDSFHGSGAQLAIMPREEIKARPWVSGGKAFVFHGKENSQIMGVAVLMSGAFSDKGEGMPSVDRAR